MATARRHSLLRLPFFCCASLHMSSYLKTCSSCLLVKKNWLHVFLSKKHDFMSTCPKNMFFMSSCPKNMFFLSSYLKPCSSCLLVKKPCSSCLLVKKPWLHVFLSKKPWLHVHHANIVQTVKNCYKIKINYRESKSRFYSVLLCKQHQCLTIAPLLQYNSATIRV